MNALFIGPHERAKLAAVREVANANPVDMRTLPDRLNTPDGKAAHKAQMTAQSVDIPATYLVTFSVENGHPVGTCRHMSMSTSRKGRLPNPPAVWMVAELLGFVGDLLACSVWIEDLQGHGEAINVVQPLLIDAQGPMQ